jgi:lambda repressor-like predicted transcriptional regulator
MEEHYGQILEKAIRRNGYSIVEIAKLTNVNRRSVYNWFNQKYLKTEIIYRIGTVLGHDFSQEFPMLFSKTDFNITVKSTTPNNDPIFWELPDHHIWQDRYISLLQQYNELLIKKILTNNSESLGDNLT